MRSNPARYEETMRKQNQQKILALTVLFVTAIVLVLGNHKKVELQKLLRVVKRDVDLQVSCDPGVPCRYPEQVDLRIIVITFNRSASLSRLLASLNELELDGDRASLEIWIDRDKKSGAVDETTVALARSFRWSRGQSRVHVQKRHVGIYGQWIDTWRPPAHVERSAGLIKGDTNGSSKEELALFIEDDIIISKFAYRWARAVHEHFSNRSDYAGATLNSDNPLAMPAIGKRKTLVGPRNDTVFMFKVLGSWGFIPQPNHWRKFQDWFHEHCNEKRPEFRPYVPGSRSTTWYKYFENQNYTHSMWTAWFIYYTYVEQLQVVFSNLATYTGTKTTCLSINRFEPGLHFTATGREKGPEISCELLSEWKGHYVTFPRNITKLDFDGSEMASGHYFQAG